MKAFLRMLFPVFALTFAGQCAHAADPQFPWPNGARAAVSLAYDDALGSQLDQAIPALDKYGLKATFYLTLAADTVARRLPEWRAAAARGHELGNHTLFHQCSRTSPGREWVAPDNDLDRISVGQLVSQIRLGNTLLAAIDGREERTFAVPCGDLRASGESYLSTIRSDFVAIRSAAGEGVVDASTLDPYAVTVSAVVDLTGHQLIAIAKQAAATGRMANFTFHGIGGDYLSVSGEAHEALLQHLAANRDVYWTDTFLNIMKYVRVQQQQRR